MPEHRQVRERGGQVLVPIPALIWRRLRIGAGSRVWWHLAGKDEAVISRGERRLGGRPRVEDTCPHCEQREKELVRLRALLQTGASVDTRVAFNQGYHAALGHGLKPEVHYGMIRRRLDEIVALLTNEAPGRARRGRPRWDRWGEVETIPSPLLSSPSEASVPSDGGADSSGAEPPGVPSET